MKAPDKIYIGIDYSHTEQSVYLDYNGLHDVFAVEPELFDQWSIVPPPVASIEYIRKDSLIEWANKMIADYKNRGKKDGYYDLLDKLYEL